MSNPFKAIGKVFKSVVKVVKNVVKGIGKIIKKLGPAVLIIGAVLTGGALLAGGFGAGGAGIFGSVGSFVSSAGGAISSGFASVFGGTAAAGTAAAGTAAAGTAAAGTTALGGANLVGAVGGGAGVLGGVGTTAGVASAYGGTSALAGLGGASLATSAATPSLLGSVWNGAKNVGGFIKDNKELVQIGANAIGGVQEEKIAEADRDEIARQFDESLEQRKAEDAWNGGIYGVDGSGNQAGTLSTLQYSPHQTANNPNADNERLDQIYQDSYNRTQLQDLYDQAYYKQQQQSQGQA